MSCWKQALSNSVWKIYLDSPASLNLCIYSLFLANGPQALQIDLGYLKCIEAWNLSPANKNLFIISFILYLYKILPIRRTLLKGELRPTNQPLAYCSLIDFCFSILQAARFDESMILPFAFKTFGFLLSVFFYTSNNKITLFYN